MGFTVYTTALKILLQEEEVDREVDPWRALYAEFYADFFFQALPPYVSAFFVAGFCPQGISIYTIQLTYKSWVIQSMSTILLQFNNIIAE